MLLKLEKETLFKKLIQKLNYQFYSYKKITTFSLLPQKLNPGLLLYIVLKTNKYIKTEYISGICISKKKKKINTSLILMNITLKMKLTHNILIHSPNLFFYSFFLKKDSLKKIKNQHLNKIYYFNKLSVKYLRSNIIIKSILNIT